MIGNISRRKDLPRPRIATPAAEPFLFLDSVQAGYSGWCAVTLDALQLHIGLLEPEHNHVMFVGSNRLDRQPASASLCSDGHTPLGEENKPLTRPRIRRHNIASSLLVLRLDLLIATDQWS